MKGACEFSIPQDTPYAKVPGVVHGALWEVLLWAPKLASPLSLLFWLPSRGGGGILLPRAIHRLVSLSP